MRLQTVLVVVPAGFLALSVVLDAFASVQEGAEVSTDPSGHVAALGPSTVAQSAQAEPVTTPSAGFLPERATTPEEVRDVLRLTRGANLDDRAPLREAALHSVDPLVAGNAARALGRLGVFRTDASLMALLQDPRARVRQDAVAACGLDGGAELVPSLAKALTEGDAGLRPLILDALGRIGGPEARALVESVVGDSASSATEKVFARVALARMEG